MSDRITVLRDGKTVATHNASDITKDGIIAAMGEREVGDIFPTLHTNARGRDAVQRSHRLSTDAADKKLSIMFRSRARSEVLGIRPQGGRSER